MKKVISVLLSALMLINLTLWVPGESAKADNKETAVKLEIGKKTEGRLEDGIVKKYELSINHIGILSISIKSYINDILLTSLYSDKNPELKLNREVHVDENKGYTIVDYSINVNPGTYYLELSNAIMLLSGDYSIESSFANIYSVEGKAENSSEQGAVKLSNNRYNLGVLSYDDTIDYYYISFSKASQLQLSIFSIENSSLDVTIEDAEGNKVHEGWGYDQMKPYSFNDTVAAGKYLIMVRRNNVAGDPNGLSYAIVTGTYVPITKITLTASKAMKTGDVYTFKPKLTPSKAAGGYVFTSSNEKVVRITEDGRATALKAGTATIKVITLDGGLTSSSKVTVQNNAVMKITLNKTKLTLDAGSSTTLKATVTPSSSNKSVTWKSSNSKVATVNSTGKVTAVGAGTCTITATAGGKSAKATITVKAKPTPTPKPKATVTPKPTITPKPTVAPKPTIAPTPTSKPAVSHVEVSEISMTKSVKLNEGESKTIAVSILPSNATNKTLVWSCTDTAVVSVENGKITGKKAGTATVVATSANGKKAYCTVVVSE